MRLTWSSSYAKVVDLPEPVEPVTSTSPWPSCKRAGSAAAAAAALHACDALAQAPQVEASRSKSQQSPELALKKIRRSVGR